MSEDDKLIQEQKLAASKGDAERILSDLFLHGLNISDVFNYNPSTPEKYKGEYTPVTYIVAAVGDLVIFSDCEVTYEGSFATGQLSEVKREVSLIVIPKQIFDQSKQFVTDTSVDMAINAIFSQRKNLGVIQRADWKKTPESNWEIRLPTDSSQLDLLQERLQEISSNLDGIEIIQTQQENRENPYRGTLR